LLPDSGMPERINFLPRFLLPALLAGLILLTSSQCVSPVPGRRKWQLEDRVVVAYWHNWDMEEAPYIRLTDLPEEVNVVPIAFAVPGSPRGGRMVFEPNVISRSQLKADIQDIQERGVRVLISIGGGNHVVNLNSPRHRRAFVNSMKSMIDEYGFDGLDIDLEGPSIWLDEGDEDFGNPTTPKIVHFIEAVREIKAHYGEEFWLTAAPETQYFTGAYHKYGETFGGYLPILEALRDDLTFVHMQLYNSGGQYVFAGEVQEEGGDPVVEQGTEDFVVGLTEMVIAGFPVGRNADQWFEGFGADRVVVGLPATPSAAHAGFLDDDALERALLYLMTGEASYDSGITLRTPEGYPGLRGVMTWSANWDRTMDGDTAEDGFVKAAFRILRGHLRAQSSSTQHGE